MATQLLILQIVILFRVTEAGQGKVPTEKLHAFDNTFTDTNTTAFSIGATDNGYVKFNPTKRISYTRDPRQNTPK